MQECDIRGRRVLRQSPTRRLEAARYRSCIRKCWTLAGPADSNGATKLMRSIEIVALLPEGLPG